MNRNDTATRADIQELRQFILEREAVAMRWVITIQITYFLGTWAVLWFLLARYKP